MTEYERDFDRLVHEYNRWFYAPIRQTIEHPLKTFFKLKKHADDLPSPELYSIFKEYPCFYEREDLTTVQKTAISLGSDLKRLEDKLKRGLIDVNIVCLDLFKDLVVEQYNQMKSIYATEAVSLHPAQYPLTGDLIDSQPPGAMVKPS